MDLQFQDLIGLVQKFRFTNLWFTNQVPREQIDGVVAAWDIEVPILDIDRDFVTPASASQAIGGGSVEGKRMDMATSFKHRALNANELAALRKPGSNARDSMGQAWLDMRARHMQQRYGAYLDEYLISQALTGTLTITVNGLTRSISYGVPGVNTFNFAGTPWSTVTTNISAHIAQMKERMVMSSGLQPRWLLGSSRTLEYIVRNDSTKAYFGHATPAGGILANGLAGQMFDGLSIVPIDSVYSSAGETEEFTSSHIALNTVYVLPDFGDGWISMQVGTDVYFNPVSQGFVETHGPISWVDYAKDPPTYLVYYRYTRLPAIKVPGAICRATVA